MTPGVHEMNFTHSATVDEYILLIEMKSIFTFMVATHATDSPVLTLVSPQDMAVLLLLCLL